GEQQGEQLSELHPDREARHHRGDRGALAHRPEAEALDINAGRHRRRDRRGRDGPAARLPLREDRGAGERADEDRRAEGEGEPPEHAEDQREPERQKRIGAPDHEPVDERLEEGDHLDKFSIPGRWSPLSRGRQYFRIAACNDPPGALGSTCVYCTAFFDPRYARWITSASASWPGAPLKL